MLSEASFLSSREAFAFELPDHIDPVPDLHSVLVHDRVGRYITYRPFDREADPRSNKMLKHRFDLSHGGRVVSVFRALDEPTTRVAFWRLENGYLQTFTDDRLACGSDPEEALQSVIGALTLGRTKAGLPSVDPQAPVSRAGANKPSSRERMIFAGRDREAAHPQITIFREPPWVPEGGRKWTKAGLAGASETNDLNVTVEAWGLEEHATEVARQVKSVAASIVPID